MNLIVEETVVKKTLAELAELVDGRLIGEDAVIGGIASLEDAGEGEISFLANPKHAAKLAASRASAVIVPKGVTAAGKTAIEVANPYLAFAKVLTAFTVVAARPRGVMEGAVVGTGVSLGNDCTIHPRACIGDNVRMGNSVVVHPGAVIYEGVEIGDDVVIHANVTVREQCRIGNRVILHAGAVIGSDGFGYAPDGDGWYKIPQVGIVVIEDDVEIGANTTIDRAAMNVTRIGRGTKIDNLVQIGHNCVIGENCMIVSQVGISGSTKVGKHVTLAGQVGVTGHVSIGDNVMVGGKGGVTGNIASGSLVSGTPAFSHKEWLRASAIFTKLPELKKTVASLDQRLQELEEKLTEKTG